jgi:hypothetical protein
MKASWSVLDQCSQLKTDGTRLCSPYQIAHQYDNCANRFPNSFPPDFAVSFKKISRYVPSRSPIFLNVDAAALASSGAFGATGWAFKITTHFVID